jgi:hypothetical protein
MFSRYDSISQVKVRRRPSLVIEAKLKFVYGVPTDFQRPGSWVIVEGTYLLVGTTGRGQMLLAFQFYGKIA